MRNVIFLFCASLLSLLSLSFAAPTARAQTLDEPGDLELELDIDRGNQRRRAALATAGGTAVAVAHWGATLGGMIVAIDRSCQADGGLFCGLGPALGVATVGLVTSPFTVSLGTWLAGDGAGGFGSYGYTLAGSLGGSLIGGALAALLPVMDEEAAAASFPVFVAMQIAGAVIGYEMSARKEERQRVRRLRALPTLSAGPDQLSLGVAGAF